MMPSFFSVSRSSLISVIMGSTVVEDCSPAMMDGDPYPGRFCLNAVV